MTGRTGPAGTQSTARALMTFGLLAPALLFLLAWFLWPLAQLLMLSFSAPAGIFSAYVSLMESFVFRAVFVNTLQLALFVTVICTLLAYPAAWLLTRVQGFWFAKPMPLPEATRWLRDHSTD